MIHAVGPIYRGGQSGEPSILADAYRSSLALASQRGIKTVAFPSISTGAYGYPIELAAPIALRTVLDHLRTPSAIAQVRLVLYTHSAHQTYVQALKELTQNGRAL